MKIYVIKDHFEELGGAFDDLDKASAAAKKYIDDYIRELPDRNRQNILQCMTDFCNEISIEEYAINTTEPNKKFHLVLEEPHVGAFFVEDAS